MKSPGNRFFSLLLLAFFISGRALAQVKGFTPLDDNLKKDAVESLAPKQLEQIKTTPADNVVNPQNYHIGPGDALTLFVSTWPQAEKTIIVTPENSILDQNLGEILINGKTLAQVRDTLQQILKKRIPSATVAMTLRQPRSVFISVSGNVIAPGSYTLPATMRVSSAVKLASQIGQNAQFTPEELTRIRKIQDFANPGKNAENFVKTASYASRNIIVLHKDGTSSVADLEKAAVYPMADYDPYLREGDEILVPSEPGAFPTVAITGGVRRPSVVPYKEGDKVSFLLKLGFGLTGTGNPEVSLVQPSGGGKIALSIDSAMNLLGADMELQPGSVINVEKSRKSTPVTQGVVIVSGEVNRPGSYVIEPNKTRLRDVIEQAGGFTTEAYLPLAQIMRRENSPVMTTSFRNNLYERFQHSNLTLNDTLRYVLDMSYRKPIVSADFSQAFRSSSSPDNVVLQDGDQINVPRNPRHVYVYGQVIKPGYVEYQPGKTMEWYIAQAGGFAEHASEGRARIIKGRNNVWVEGDDNVMVDAGDEIYVPHPPDIPRTDEIQAYSIIVSAIGIAVSITLGIISFLRYN